MNVEILEEKPVLLASLKSVLKDMEETQRVKRLKEYVDLFVKVDVKKAEELMKKISDLKIPRLKDRHMIKIIDVMPNDLIGLRALFVGEGITIKQDDLNRILEVIKS